MYITVEVLWYEQNLPIYIIHATLDLDKRVLDTHQLYAAYYPSIFNNKTTYMMSNISHKRHMRPTLAENNNN